MDLPESIGRRYHGGARAWQTRRWMVPQKPVGAADHEIRTPKPEVNKKGDPKAALS
jgi:hypothetical protein